MGYLNLLISIRIVISKKFEFVRLNLFNHVLVLFHAKFACILTIRYLVFRWKLCKGCVCESVKKTQVVCIQRSLATGSRNWLMTSKSPKCHTCEECRKLKGHESWSTSRQKVQSSQAVNSQLKLATHPTCETESPKCIVMQKNDFSHSSCTLL